MEGKQVGEPYLRRLEAKREAVYLIEKGKEGRRGNGSEAGERRGERHDGGIGESKGKRGDMKDPEWRFKTSCEVP